MMKMMNLMMMRRRRRRRRRRRCGRSQKRRIRKILIIADTLFWTSTVRMAGSNPVDPQLHALVFLRAYPAAILNV